MPIPGVERKLEASSPVRQSADHPRIFLGPLRIVLVVTEEASRHNGGMRFRRLKRIELVSLAAAIWSLVSLGASPLPQRSVTLAWDPSTEPSVVGYRLYVGGASETYTNMIDVGNATTATTPGLTIGITYFFAVTAYNASGLESPFSGEISCSIPAPSQPPARLQIRPVPGGRILLGAGGIGHSYDILASQDLCSWKAIGTVTVDGSGSFDFTDPVASSYSSRFYRLHEVTLPPPTPTFQISRSANGQVRLAVAGQAGHTYEILATRDFVSYTVIGRGVSDTAGGFQFNDPAGSSSPWLFYRLQDVTFPEPPTLQISRPVNGQVPLIVTGLIGHSYEVLASRDLSSWTLIGSGVAGPGGSLQFSDPIRNGYSSRFYRVREVSL
jgi:hypothetical protein